MKLLLTTSLRDHDACRYVAVVDVTDALVDTLQKRVSLARSLHSDSSELAYIEWYDGSPDLYAAVGDESDEPDSHDALCEELDHNDVARVEAVPSTWQVVRTEGWRMNVCPVLGDVRWVFRLKHEDEERETAAVPKEKP